MGIGRFWVGGTLAVVLGTSSGSGLAGQASPPAPQLAQVTPNTVTGQLNENSATLEDGSYFNVHTFEGQAGEAISIEMVSAAFDTYLMLVGPEGQTIAQDDDGNGGTNSRIVVTLPTTGTYQILANSYAVGAVGPYTLTWQPATAADAAQAEALQRATDLDQQVMAALQQIGRYREAIPLAEEALAIRREQLGESHPDVATSLNNLAELYREQGHYEEAEPLYQQSLAIRREQLGERHPAVVTSLNNLAGLYYSQGPHGEAEPLLQEALSIRREQLGNRHLDVAQSLDNLALLYQVQGRYGEAEPLHQEALSIRREQLGNRHLDVAQSLDNLALLYYAQGRYEEAEPLYRDVLAINREQLGEHHPDVAQSLNQLALLYHAQGRYREAELLCQDALTINREQLGERHPAVATSLDNLALLYQAQGRYEEAEPLYQNALAIFREQMGNRHPDVARSLIGLASLYREQGRYGEAESLFQEALAIQREQLGNRHPYVAASLNGLASTYEEQGRYEEAEPLYQNALAIFREQLGNRHPDAAANLSNLAKMYYFQGHYKKAEPLFQEALAIWREQFGNRHPDVATGLNNLAALYQAQGNAVQAVQFFQQGLAIEEQNLDLNLASLTEAQRQDYAATLSGTTNGAVSLALQTPEAQSLGLTTLLRRKGRLLEAGSSSWQRLRQNLTPADQTTLDEFIALGQQLATLTFNPPANLPPDAYRQQLAQLETQIAEREKTLARRSAVFRVEAEPVEIAAVQAQIPADGVLVEYARYRPFDAQADPNRFGNPRYAAYLLFPDGRIEVVDLGDAAEIDAAVQSFVGLLQNRRAQFQRSAPVPTLRGDDVEQVTSNIKALVFDPIAPYLQDVDHLLISPDGQLNLLPFEALQTEAGGDYLVQQYQISYLSSGRDLLKFDLLAPSANPAVIVANPDYEGAMLISGVWREIRKGRILLN